KAQGRAQDEVDLRWHKEKYLIPERAPSGAPSKDATPPIQSAADTVTRFQARSLMPVSCSAQWAQQESRPPTSTPWPTIRHLQWAQVGAVAWMAHSKLSNTMARPSAVTSWNDLS